MKKEKTSVLRPKGVITIAACLLMIALFAMPANAIEAPPGTIPPSDIQKFENVLTGAPPVWVPYHSDSAKDQYVINMSQFEQQILPQVLERQIANLKPAAIRP